MGLSRSIPWRSPVASLSILPTGTVVAWIDEYFHPYNVRVRAYSRNVDAVVDRLSKTFVAKVSDDLTVQINRIKASKAPDKVKKKAEDYLTLGLVVPEMLERIFKDGGWTVFQPLVVEGMAGTGKSTTLQRWANGLIAVSYVSCKL